VEWVIALETQIEEDTTHHGEASGKDKDELEPEQKEKYDKGH